MTAARATAASLCLPNQPTTEVTTGISLVPISMPTTSMVCLALASWTLKSFWVASQPSTSLDALWKDSPTFLTRSLNPSLLSPVS